MFLKVLFSIKPVSRWTTSIRDSSLSLEGICNGFSGSSKENWESFVRIFGKPEKLDGKDNMAGTQKASKRGLFSAI
jgi:hypothetical protein